MAAESDKLDKAVDRIVQAMQPEAIYLFGSRARGEEHADSDYDLLVIVPDDAPAERSSLSATARVRRLLPVKTCPARRALLPRPPWNLNASCES